MKKAGKFGLLWSFIGVITLMTGCKDNPSHLTENFEQLQQELDETNKITQFKRDSIARLLAEGYGPTSEGARFLDSVSAELDAYLSVLKKDITKAVENDGYEAWESSGYLDTRFFTGATISPGGHEFIGRIDVYRMAVSQQFKKEYPEIIKRMEEDFSTAPIIDQEGRQQNWLPYNFKGFPLVAAMTKITQMQADIKQTKVDLFSAILLSEE